MQFHMEVQFTTWWCFPSVILRHWKDLSSPIMWKVTSGMELWLRFMVQKNASAIILLWSPWVELFHLQMFWQDLVVQCGLAIQVEVYICIHIFLENFIFVWLCSKNYYTLEYGYVAFILSRVNVNNLHIIYLSLFGFANLVSKLQGDPWMCLVMCFFFCCSC